MLEQLVIASLNFLLRRAPWATRRLQAFAGREARFVMPPLAVTAHVGADGLFEPSLGTPPSVEITLPADTPLVALRGKDAMLGAARITGSADFADVLGLVLRNLEWDAEEDLSRVFGDIAARRLAAFGRAFARWNVDMARRMAENGAEYLQYENPQLLARVEAHAFGTEVEALRRRQEQLEQRLARLEARR